MPDVTITIGGRDFDVACQTGEEEFLHNAAGLLDHEAQTLLSQAGRVPEARMLLMAGLMLADRTAAEVEKTAALEDRVSQLEAELQAMRDAPPQEVQVPFVPDSVTEGMAELAARAEAMAQRFEDSKR